MCRRRVHRIDDQAADSPGEFEMPIGEHKVVSIDYGLTDDEGNVLDSSDGREPVTYLHGDCCRGQ